MDGRKDKQMNGQTRAIQDDIYFDTYNMLVYIIHT
jgi:hypothetical protein